MVLKKLTRNNINETKELKIKIDFPIRRKANRNYNKKDIGEYFLGNLDKGKIFSYFKRNKLVVGDCDK